MDVIQLIDQYYKTHDLTKQAERFIRDPSLLPDLVEIAVSKLPHPYPESASWILTHVLKLKPELLIPFNTLFIDTVLTSTNQSVLRNIMHVLSTLPLTEYQEGKLLDRLIGFIADSSNKVALFVYSLYKLNQFCNTFPELRSEIDAILEKRLSEDPSPAMRIAVRNYRKSLS